MSRSFYFALFCNIKVSLHYKLSVKSIIYLKCASHSFDTMRTNVVSCLCMTSCMDLRVYLYEDTHTDENLHITALCTKFM